MPAADQFTRGSLSGVMPCPVRYRSTTVIAIATTRVLPAPAAKLSSRRTHQGRFGADAIDISSADLFESRAGALTDRASAAACVVRQQASDECRLFRDDLEFGGAPHS